MNITFISSSLRSLTRSFNYASRQPIFSKRATLPYSAFARPLSTMSAKYAKDLPAGATNRIEKVAIVGAGGHVGKFLAEELVKTGKHTVTAITRGASKTQLASGVRVAPVDYDDEATLAEALKGQQFLIISLPPTAPKDTQSKLIRAAAKADVRWILPNSYALDYKNEQLMKDNLLGFGPWAAVDEIKKLGVSSSILLTCGFWYEYSLSRGALGFGIDINKREVLLLDGGEVKVNTSTFEQCGRAIAALLSLPELPRDEADAQPTVARWRDDVLFISSFLLSQRDMLASVQRATGTSDADWTVTQGGAEQRWKDSLAQMRGGDPLGFVRQMYARGFFPGDGDFGAKHGLANEALGLPEEDLEAATKRAVEWAEEGRFSSYGSAGTK